MNRSLGILLCAALVLAACTDTRVLQHDAGPEPVVDVDGCVAGEEQCNGLDDDCDGETDENMVGACALSLGVCAGAHAACGGSAGFLECSYGSDYESTESLCDELDNDCDGTIDETCPCTDGAERSCGTDAGECTVGTQLCVGELWGECTAQGPVDEICDGNDNDCDGLTDEELETPSCALSQGVCVGSHAVCLGSGAWSSCEESYGPSYEASEITCDGLDNDCDGNADEALGGPSCPLTRGVCAGSTGACGGSGGWLACTAASYGTSYELNETRCDGLDNDCDGTTDENCGCSLPGSDCAATEICACPAYASACTDTGTCRPLFGSYGIEIATADLPAADPAGLCWDGDCSAPDPFVSVYVDGIFIGSTPSRDNTRFPTWSPARVRATLANGSTVRFDVYDEDVLNHDFAFMCSVQIDATTLRNRTFTCTAGSGQVVRGAFAPAL